MKAIIIYFVLVSITVMAGAWYLSTKPDGTPTPLTATDEGKTAGATFEDLLDAIEQVESGGNSDAVGDNGRAVGAYQLHKIYVDDVNRILKRHEFGYNCRKNRYNSRRMVFTYLSHYGGSFEEMARKHNGGPTGHLKDSTKPYWEKVRKAMQ